MEFASLTGLLQSSVLITSVARDDEVMLLKKAWVECGLIHQMKYDSFNNGFGSFLSLT